MGEIFNSKEKAKIVRSDEKTPPMFGSSKIFRKDKSSESIHTALLQHVGDTPMEEIETHEKPLEEIELEKEVVEDDEDFVPVGTMTNAQEDEELSNFDMRISVPPDAPKIEKEQKDPMINEPEIGPHPNDETIVTAVLKEVEKRTEHETRGFKSAGEKTRIVLPDIPTDPDKVGRVTELGLKMIEMAEKRRIQINKK